jgi:peptide subunit release factor 1 (eRF1)
MYIDLIKQDSKRLVQLTKRYSSISKTKENKKERKKVQKYLESLIINIEKNIKENV